MNSSSVIYPAGQDARPADFSARDVIVASYRYFFANAKFILRAILVPVIMAAIVLLGLFKIYFSMLAAYLSAPDARTASLTISITIVGCLIWLLLNVFASARLARFIQGQGSSVPFNFRDMALESRLYAAVLRSLLVFVLAGVLDAWIVSFVSGFLSEPQADYAAWLGAFGFLVFVTIFTARCGLLIPALALYEHRRVLRRGWLLSRTHFWSLAAVSAAVTVLPAILLQTLGEFLTQLNLDRIEAPGISLPSAASSLATDGLTMATIVLTLTLSSAISLTLTTIGSCLVYQRLVGRPSAPD